MCYLILSPHLETDLIPGLSAFVACLVLPLQLGILVGIGINVIFILYQAARPKLSIETLSVSTLARAGTYGTISKVPFSSSTDSQWSTLSDAHTRSLPHLPLHGVLA